MIRLETKSFIVASAFVRSFTQAQVSSDSKDASAFVFVDPTDQEINNLKGRIIIFGELPASLFKNLGIQSVAAFDPSLFECSPAAFHSASQSAGVVHYKEHELNKNLFDLNRPLCRFDFLDEWNNLNFGRINKNDLFGISSTVAIPKENELAHIDHLSYAGLWDFGHQSILWFNRAVGPVDSSEWTIVENFLTDYRPELVGTHPRYLEIPYGMTAAVTMRLDCDEDILSARPLFELYSKKNLPFSLAIKTDILNQDSVEFLKNIDVLSHSHSHPANWGVNFEQALFEARHSKYVLKQKLERPIEMAVSPFHTNKDYSIKALSRTHYRALVCGIIKNDPEYLIARAGYVDDPDLLLHSQQCMLHGDCVLDTSDPLKIYKQAFMNAQRSQTFFGYLDHPFSPRYQYGWQSEEQRLKLHDEFTDFMINNGAQFFSESEALQFLIQKNQSSLSMVERPLTKLKPGTFQLAVRWRGQTFAAKDLS